MKCQKCRQAIKLHSSLEDTNPAALNLLIGASSTSNNLPDLSNTSSKPLYSPDRQDLHDKASQNSGAATFKRPSSSLLQTPGGASNHTRSQSTPNASHKSIYGNGTESFVVLTQSQVIPPSQLPRQPNATNSPDGGGRAGASDDNALSKQIKRSENLFEILSARTDVDHPICIECSDLLVEGYTKKLATVTRERDAFVEFLKKTNAAVPSDAEQAAADAEIRELEAEEAAAIAELQQLEAERAEVEAELQQLDADSKRIDAEEEEFWRSRNRFAQRLEEFQNERDSINLQYDHDSRQLEKLQRTNVYNDTFCIGHDGYFGTINGLRLGRLPSQPVEWPEINAAWGQTLLLLATVADKLSFTFTGYRLKPTGSTSRIERIDNDKVTTLELFSSGDLPLGRMFMHRRFDSAMVAFLECLRQLSESVEQRDPDLALPYRIAKDRIGDSCIRLAFNQDEAWTRACKYTLTCVKFLLAHTSNTAYAKRNGGAS
ncbi:autophagy protein Apg6-domain-containing protein [Geopyxis carbonaria]|nr:autophagy protein Apg6-domain-containing protein [Geopyxis carbonaria]